MFCTSVPHESRQAGKTTLMEMVKEHLDTIGERTLFLNLDIEWDRPHFESQAALIKKIELELDKQKSFTKTLNIKGTTLFFCLFMN